MNVTVLASRGVVLDEFRDDDAEAITRACSEPVFERFMLTPWPYEREHAIAFIRELAPAGWRTGDEPTWAIRERSGGPACGSISIRMRTQPPDLGYWLAREHRGRGLMTEAVRLVIGHARTLGAETIGWECVSGNHASAAVAKRAGFRFTYERPGRASRVPGTACWHALLDEAATADPAAAAASWREIGL